ncbi:MFS transporter [Massilia horti]|uniref:MFS transporter n=1 Tax=Massilia horti TaxID=2562153 RepID=A0A4Y9SVV8_9BURK|nr:MFS transporter [Massilia horti]TFW28783.1 MFS transporter [Massilia horti]
MNKQATATGPPTGNLRWAVLAILLATFMGVLDASIANIALPAIAVDLHTQPARAVWIVNAYQIALATAVLPLAALGERFGYKHVFLAGLVIFTFSSLLCTLAPSLPLLLASRALQGLGAACTSTIIPALLRAVYPPREVGRGVGYLALTVASSAALGPTVAAAILSVAGWRWLFGVNLPIGIVAIVMTARLLPGSGGAHRPFDLPGSLLNAAAIALLIIGVGGLGNRAGRPLAIAEIVLSLVAGAALIAQQRGRPMPLVPFDLLRIPMMRLSAGTSVSAYAAQMIAFVVLPFMLVSELGRGASATGLLLTPWPLVILVIGPVSGRLSDRHRADLIGAAGLALLTLGLAMLVLMPPKPSDWQIVWRVALCGIGFGLFQTPNNRLMITCAPPERSGAAGGVMTMARMLGMTLGAALATIMLDLYGVRGAHEAIVIAAIVCGLGVLVGLRRAVRATHHPTNP